MCENCWKEYGAPDVDQLPENGAEVAAMINRLYAQPDGGMGGPLHTVLDDWNIEDGQLDPYGDDWLPETWGLAQQISAALSAMTLTQRAAVLATAQP